MAAGAEAKESGELLRAGIAALGLSPEGGLLDGLRAYLDELELWNPRAGLVRASGEELVTKHVLDSLAGVGVLRRYPHATVADIGSGAGLPGIPLALSMADSRVTLVERSARRAAFLRTAVTLLDLSERVEVVERDLAEVGGRFDIVAIRAFGNLHSFLPALLARTTNEGVLAAYKGRRKVIDGELAEIGDAAALVEIAPLSVPGLDEERHMVIMRR